jgi:lipid-A-disaccharide synthase
MRRASDSRRANSLTTFVPLPPPQRQPALLFTAFEPSGDDHASAVIAELKRRHPSLPIFAWGGPKMHRAGATIIERTGDDAVMGLPGLAKIIDHLRINRRIDKWIAENLKGETPIALHVPVDSPAANGPICKIAKGHNVKVCHLVAPQIWAWGRWRIHKLRRITDLLLCVLPFEPKFFADRNVPAKFIGHFLFDHELPLRDLDLRAATFPEGSPRIAMMPGSRPNELERHFPILLDAYHQLQQNFPNIAGVVAATSDKVADTLRKIGDAHPKGWPQSVRCVVQDTDAVIRWCDIALVKSGTVTMQVARQLKPMVIFYKKSNPLIFLIARTFVTTRHFALPNVIANRRVIPELVPHFGGAGPIVALAERLLNDPAEAEQQREAMRDLARMYEKTHATRSAADEIERMAGLTPA